MLNTRRRTDFFVFIACSTSRADDFCPEKNQNFAYASEQVD